MLNALYKITPLGVCLLLFSVVASAQLPSISGLKLHLDAAVGFNANGPSQATWTDQSSSGNNMISGTGTKEPVYVASAASSGFPGIQFDGTDDYMENTALNKTFSDTAATLFIVRIANNYHTTGIGGGYKCMVTIANDHTQYNEVGLGSDWTLHHSTTGNWTQRSHQCYDTIPVTKPVVMMGVFGGGIYNVDHTVNGNYTTIPISVQGGPVPLLANINRRITIGGRYQSPSYTNVMSEWFVGYMLELVAYNRKLTTAEIKLVNDYLVNKYSNTNVFTIKGDTVCAGEQAYLTYTVPGGPSTVTINYTDGTNNYSKSVGNGVPFALVPNPTTTTTYTASLGGSTTPCLSIFGSQASATVFVYPKPVADAGNDTTVCAGSAVQLHGSGGGSYYWYPGSNLSSQVISNPTTTTTTNTSYYLVVSDDKNCKDTDMVAINVLPRPTFSVSPTSSTLCLGKSLTMTASGGNKYLWFPSTGLSATNTSSVSVSPKSDIIYQVIITDTVCGDNDTLSVNVTTKLPPIVTATSSGNADCHMGDITLTATGAKTYEWSPAEKVKLSTEATTGASINKPTTFTVVGTDAWGCKDTAEVNVEFSGINSLVFFMPDAFTPNNDGKNDCFKVHGSIAPDDFEIMIYNRWGNRVFYSKDINACWDGRNCEVGAYNYYLRFKTAVCGNIEKKGTIQLIL